MDLSWRARSRLARKALTVPRKTACLLIPGIYQNQCQPVIALAAKRSVAPWWSHVFLR